MDYIIIRNIKQSFLLNILQISSTLEINIIQVNLILNM